MSTRPFTVLTAAALLSVLCASSSCVKVAIASAADRSATDVQGDHADVYNGTVEGLITIQQGMDAFDVEPPLFPHSPAKGGQRSDSSWSTRWFPFQQKKSRGKMTAEGGRSTSAAFRPQSEEESSTSSTSFTKSIWFVVVVDAVLLCFAALFAGLTLAVMGLDTLSLEIIASSGAEPDRTYAARILPLRKKGNQLLCTLILGNVMVNTLIAQVTDSVAEGWISTVLSTALITVGGEILPQALMSAHALYIGSRSSPILNGFMILFWPICKPVSMFLDVTIGSDPGQIYSRNELKRLMAAHSAHSHESGVDRSDLDMMVGAIDLKEKSVLSVLTPMSEVFMLEANRRVNDELLQQVAEKGHSRIPVYAGQRNNIVGVLHTKDLLLASTEDNTRIMDLVRFYQRKYHTVPSETKLYSMLRYFQTGASHIALVQEVQQSTAGNGDPFYTLRGIVTLEDVMEELLQREILDEHDVEAADADNGKVISRKNTARTQRRIHLSSNQLTACALFLQSNLPEFKDAEVQLLASTLGHYSTVYRIRPPVDAAGLSWSDASTVLLYGPASVGSNTVGGGSASANVSLGAGAHNSALAAMSVSPLDSAAHTSLSHCAGVMTLIIAGRAEVSPCLKKPALGGSVGGGGPSALFAVGGGNGSPTPDAEALVAGPSVVADLQSWSLINVAGMRQGISAGGNALPIDFYCRVTSDSLVLQISHTQYKQALAALRRDRPVAKERT